MPMKFPIFAARPANRSISPGMEPHGDMVVLSISEYEKQQAIIDLYGKLAVAEKEITDGAKGKDFLTTARQLRERIHGTEL